MSPTGSPRSPTAALPAHVAGVQWDWNGLRSGNVLGQMGEAERVLMCLTMHFTAKLLKSCAVYTPTFEYLSSGQFNYPGPSVISAALLSLCFCSSHERFVCSFIKIRAFAGSKTHIPAQISLTLFLLHPCIYRYCTHPPSYKVI